MNVLVSVIVPVYNVGPYIQHCYDSIKQQTISDFEIIFVDDGSTDNTLEVCRRLAEFDERIHIIHKDNGGVSSARNEGLNQSIGEYIAFIDGDDIIAPFYLESMLNACEGSILSVCMHERIDTYEHVFDDFEGVFKNIKSSICALKVLKGNFPISVCTCIFKRNRIGKLRFVNGLKNNEDKLFLYMFLLQNEEEFVSVSSDKLYGYYVREGSASRTTWDGSLDTIRVADEMYNKTKCCHPEWECIAYLNKMRANMDTLKSIARYQKKSENDKLVFKEIKTEILSMRFPVNGGQTLKTEYIALKLGNPFFLLLVKIYYLVMNDHKRFKRNEKQIEFI